MTMHRNALIEKTLNEADGMYELRINNHLMFRAADNDTIKFIGEAIAQMSEAGDYSTLVIH